MMVRANPTPTPAPDSPRSSESPAPAGVQGDLESELVGLVHALYNLGTTVVNDLAKEKERMGGTKQVGAHVNDVIDHLATIDDMAQHVHTMIPIQVLQDIDSARNPLVLTRERIERAASENQFMNGKIEAVDAYRKHLDEMLSQNFPELTQYLSEPQPAEAMQIDAVHLEEQEQNSLNGHV